MNSVSVRHFLITHEDGILRLSNAKYERLISVPPTDKLSQFSGERVRTAEVVVEMSNRKPVRVLRVIYFYLHFDENGAIDYGRFMSDGAIVANAGMPEFLMEETEGNIVNAQKMFAKRQRDCTVWWRPSGKMERTILDSAIEERKCKCV